MSCRITYTPDFARQLKHLAKKYKSILAEIDTEIKLLTIYDKTERENLTDKELLDLMQKNGL